jgi:glutamate--cysteine ligase
MGNSTAVQAGTPPQEPSPLLRNREQAEGYVAMVCFKHGPPRLHGVELEWTLHDSEHPTRPVDLARLRAALGEHTPATVDPASPHIPLSRGSLVTVEPGGQVEISSPPDTSVDTVLSHTRADGAELGDLLRAHDLVPGSHGLDPHRPPSRVLSTPRYVAMEQAYDPIGPEGAQMMCSSASLQVCLDAGEASDIPARWAAAHALGPPLVALFANSRYHAGQDTRWASARLRSVLGTCPPVTLPPPDSSDPAAHWAGLAMDAPVICIRRDGSSWAAPAGLTFAGWIAGAARGDLQPPTTDDLDYHLSTMFPPVRPRGYLEIRYVDAQPGDGWVHPFVLTCALMSSSTVVDAVLDVTAPARDRWMQAGQLGLEDPAVRRVAAAVVDLGCGAMTGLDLAPVTRSTVIDHVQQLVSTNSRRCSA